MTIAILPYISFGLSISLWNSIFPRSDLSPISHFSKVTWESIQGNFRFYLVLPREFFLGVPFYSLVYLLTIPFALLGIKKRYRDDYHLITYVILTLCLYTVWPYIQGIRFVFPILPVYLSFVLTGIEEGKEYIPWGQWKQWKRTICALLFVVVISCFLRSSSKRSFNIMQHRKRLSGPFTETSQAMFAFIRGNTEKESTIIFFKPRVMRLQTGRKSKWVHKKEKLSHGDYLCYYRCDRTDYQMSAKHIKRLREQRKIHLRYTNADFDVYLFP